MKITIETTNPTPIPTKQPSKELITMKRIVLLLLVTVSFGICDCPDGYSDTYKGYTALNAYTLPHKTGTYYVVKDSYKDWPENVYSNGEQIKIGDSYMYSKWKELVDWKYYKVDCKVVKQGYDLSRLYKGYKYCAINGLKCDVTEIPQFYWNNGTEVIPVYYYTLRDYRSDGTLAWTREQSYSTDISCYDKSGMDVIKKVNNPKACELFPRKGMPY